MAIVKMNKFDLFILQAKKDELLSKLQKFEGVQFRNLQKDIEGVEDSFMKIDNEGEKISQLEMNLAEVKFCINLLESYITKEKGLAALKKEKKSLEIDELNNLAQRINWKETYEGLKNKDSKLTALRNETTKMDSEIEGLNPWVNLDAPIKELKELKYSQYILGSIPVDSSEAMKKELEEKVTSSYFEVINEEKGEAFILALYHLEDSSIADEIIKSYNFTKVNFNYDDTPKNIIDNFNKRIKEIKKEELEIENSFKKYGTELEDLYVVYQYYTNEVNRAKASENFIKSEKVTALEGWVTADLSDELIKAIKETCGEHYFIQLKEAEDEEDIPILLKNNAFVEPFESITEMYSLPHYREVDPTPVFSIFYVIFFGMMLSDAGYGLLLVLGTLYALKKLSLDKGTRNFMKLFHYLGYSTVFWGIIYGGFFGNALNKIFNIKVGFLDKPILNPQEGLMTVLGLAVVFGIVHIFVGLGMKAYILIRDKKYLDMVFDVLLWYFAVIGLLLLLGGSYIGAPPIIGKTLTILGLVGLLITQGRDAETLGGKIGGGIYGLYGITSYVGDIVSYSRLLALGLATGFIAQAFNLMITLFPPIIEFSLGLVLFVILHLFNLGINALGAYVHTSRLQYLEFFNKFYEGGGKKFIPFKSDEKYIKVKRS